MFLELVAQPSAEPLVAANSSELIEERVVMARNSGDPASLRKVEVGDNGFHGKRPGSGVVEVQPRRTPER